MGRRSEQRIAISFPVTVHGSDSRGNKFTVATETFDISLSGASVKGLTTITEPGGKIEIESGDQNAWYSVQWIGKNGSSKAGRIGLRCLEPGKYIWGVPARGSEPDTYDPAKPEPLPRRPSAPAGAYAAPTLFGGDERRKFARHACRIETQVVTEDGSIGVPGTITDVSLGGCYVEMLSPLPVDSTIHLSLNPGTTLCTCRARCARRKWGWGWACRSPGWDRRISRSCGDSRRLRPRLQRLRRRRRRGPHRCAKARRRATMLRDRPRVRTRPLNRHRVSRRQPWKQWMPSSGCW
jgi:hypothetical protein